MTDHRSAAILCLRALHDAEVTAQARECLTAPGFDWAGFRQFAQQERIGPLLHHALSGAGILPTETAQFFHRAYLETAWANANLLEEAVQIVVLFGAAHIPVVLLKGAALVVSRYPKAALRPMGDIDLLVPVRCFRQAKEILWSLGYRADSSFNATLSEDIVSELHYHRPDKSGVSIDLHSSLFTPPNKLLPSKENWFWDQIDTVQHGSHQFSVFSQDAQLLHLSSHHIYHNLLSYDGSLLRLNDIDWLIRTSSIHWDFVIECATYLEMLLPLQRVLAELAKDWHTPVPDLTLSALNRLVPSQPEARKLQVMSSFDQKYGNAFWLSVMNFPNWSNRLRFAWWSIFPPTSYMKNRYQVRSPILLPFYYLYRIINRLLKQVRRT